MYYRMKHYKYIATKPLNHYFFENQLSCYLKQKNQMGIQVIYHSNYLVIVMVWEFKCETDFPSKLFLKLHDKIILMSLVRNWISNKMLNDRLFIDIQLLSIMAEMPIIIWHEFSDIIGNYIYYVHVIGNILSQYHGARG